MAANCHDELQMKFNELLQVWDLNCKLLRGERESDSKYALRSTQFISCVCGCAFVTDSAIVFQETSAVQLICCLHLFFLVPFSSESEYEWSNFLG